MKKLVMMCRNTLPDVSIPVGSALARHEVLVFIKVSCLLSVELRK
jgi:hypothetical protein